MSKVIEINNLTKDYGDSKGVFDVNITINKGEVFGFLGPNGAGKTTTIRNLLGFIKPDKGNCTIFGLDCFEQAPKIQSNLGYLAGEIAFIDDMKGQKLLTFMKEMKHLENDNFMNDLVARFDLDIKGKIKKMSKGMKQKVGIVNAFMSNPDVLILDEPTSGLDPLMQKRFIDLILEEKEKGKTILMSSHIFEEIEKTCDRVAIIKNGRIVAIENVEALKAKRLKTYLITFENAEDLNRFKTLGFKINEKEGLSLNVSVNKVDELLKALSAFKIIDLDVTIQNLEEIFMHYYGGDM